jgi:methionine-rich copper-binding protein CopC
VTSPFLFADEGFNLRKAIGNGICRMTRIAPWSALFIVLAFSLLMSRAPDRAWAHAILLESSPSEGAVLAESPTLIWLRFNSRLENPLCRLTLISEDGRRYDLPNPQAQEVSPGQLRYRLPHLPAGAYNLRYSVVATDGHTTEGVVHFRIVTPR